MIDTQLQTAGPDIQPGHSAIVAQILRDHLPDGALVWVYGSRARRSNRRYSDIDLAIDMGRQQTREERYGLIDAFDDSNLPYRVDITDLQRELSPIFLANLMRDRLPFPFGGH